VVAPVARTFDVLGPLRVLIDGVDVTPRAPKERSLLALLLVQPGGVVSADRIIDELWAKLPIEQARRVLWVRVSGLRKLLDRAGAASLLELVAPGYRLAVNADEIDAQRFRTLVAAARGQRERGEVSDAAESLHRALALWRGEPLADAQGCLGLEAEADRLAEARLDAVEDWIDAELARGRHEEVRAEVCHLAATHPLRERLGRQRALCLLRAGRPAEALGACQQLRDRLCEELGVEPGPELRGLEREIRQHGATPEVPTDPDPAPHPIQRRSAFHPTALTIEVDAAGTDPPNSSAGTHRRPRPLEPRSSPRHNLPLELTRFVGRAAELDEVAELLSTYRLVTLTGVGGVGKTRLALAVATAAGGRYRDGVWLVELAPVGTGTGVVPAFARALGIMTTGERGPDDLIRWLAGRRTLLVVDTAEHVVATVGRLVHQLLAGCRELTVIVTSREPLHLPGEVVFAVPPLSLSAADGAGPANSAASDAVTLFCDRVRAARPGAAMNGAELAAGTEICRRLDGLPLAIELAAARVRVLGVHQIAERLDDCFSLLAAGAAAGVPERQRTLRATLDWSHDLLTPGERTALRRLAVFPDQFDLDAAIAVLEPDEEQDGDGTEDGLTLVTHLVDKSLVVVVVGTGDDVRYRLLDPIRQYAAEKLAAAGETEILRSRHRDVFVARNSTLWPLMTAQHRQRASADRGSLIAALEWSWREGNATAAMHLVVMQANSWMCVGDAQARAWLERVLAEPEPAVHPARTRALCLLALSLTDAAGPDGERIDKLLAAAAAVAVQVGDDTELAACRLATVEIVLARGRVAEARPLVVEALAIYERLGYVDGIAWCHYFLGWVAVADDDPVAARRSFERALELTQSTPRGEWLLPHALAALAPIVARLGEPAYAVQLADEAVASARSFAGRAVLAMALARSAEAAIVSHDRAVAARSVDELLKLLVELGTRRWAADALEMATVVLERGGCHAEAAVALGTAEQLRAATRGRGGGVRTVAGEVRRSVRLLRAALGPARSTLLEARGRALSPERAMAEAVVALDATDAT
jgi:predicted ATPase/DNA-binding SARP family transcriptional activator